MRNQKINWDCSQDLIFQISNWYTCDEEYGVDFDDDFDDGPQSDPSKYLVKIFGTTQNGESVAVNLLNFTPYFYIRVDHQFNARFIQNMREYIVSKLPWNLKNSLISIKMFEKKDFWGFTNFKNFTFLRFTFKSLKGFRAGIRIMNNDVKIMGVHNNAVKYKLYESNIEPFLRLMHIKELEPSGWCTIPGNKHNVNRDTLKTTCQIDVECDWKHIKHYENEKIAPFVVASFDLECTSSHGDFPVAKKDYKKVANELYNLFKDNKEQDIDEIKRLIQDELVAIFTPGGGKFMSRVFPKTTVNVENIQKIVVKIIDDIFNTLCGKIVYKSKQEDDKPVAKEYIVKVLCNKFNSVFPQLEGDSIIQIGTTVHKYGDKHCSYKNIVTFGTCDQIDGVDVIPCATEEELLLKWRDVILALDPDIMIGYNIFGFDMAYLYDRACELGIERQFTKLGRFVGKSCEFKEKMLSSSALGDNILKFIDMDGRVLIDIMKVVQRDHKLDSFKLDNVANHFIGLNKHDVHPSDIFRLQKGNSSDRKIIAEYCIQDCELCNLLTMKLEILANNIGMSNVCSVPLSYIFMRGQGIKIFSLVAKECKNEDFLIPSMQKPFNAPVEQDDDDGYEGAIVLEPKTGIYIDEPICVLDYASLYPSSMISENLSHDCIVTDPKYDNLPDVEYLNISYDVYEGAGDKKHKVGERVCRFVQLPNNEKGIIPRILIKLLRKRKETRKKCEWQTVTCSDGRTFKGLVNQTADTTSISCHDGNKVELNNSEIRSIDDTYDDFQKAVLDGLQLAYKVTANSLYGQIGARTSPIYLKDIAACTTATGRKMILLAKDFIEKNNDAEIVYGDSVTGDTPLILRFPDGHIDIQTIETVNNNWIPYTNFKPFDSDRYSKEQSFLNAEIWTNGKWAKINRVIRHKTCKRLYRINTFEGCVDVTEDHSLLDSNCNQIKPTECHEGITQLLHSFPDIFPEMSIPVNEYGSSYNHESCIVQKCKTRKNVYNETMFYKANYRKRSNTYAMTNECKLCIKHKKCKIQGKLFDGVINKKILNYHVPCYNVSKYEAWVWGLFFGDGSCGIYKYQNKIKYSWAINNSNLQYLDKAFKYLQAKEPSNVVKFKVLDTLDSSGVYKLVPTGSIKYMVEKYREMFYDKDGYKKVPIQILNAPYDVRLWFMKGYLTADGTKDTETRNNGIKAGKWAFACKGKIGAQGLFYLMKSVGWKNIRVNIHHGKDNVYWICNITDTNHVSKHANTVMHKIQLKDTDINDNTYVYDIETSEGVFHGGVGSIILKNTDSLFVKFYTKDELGNRIKGKDAIPRVRELGIKNSKAISKILKPPHDLEWEKIFYPFILLSKKRYVANKYEWDDHKYKQNSMGIVLKRRDNANIVKKIYGGIIDTILNEQNIEKSIDFLSTSLNDLVSGKYHIDDLVITKSLKADYKDPGRIAHKMLADRMKERDPGNAPNVNDRIPFVYIETPPPEKKGTKVLQGERIETPDFINANNLKPDYEFYITNQIMNPVLQVYALVLDQLKGYDKSENYWPEMEAKVLEAKGGDVKKMQARVQDLREHVVKELLFDPVLNVLKAKRTPPKPPKEKAPPKPRQPRAKKTVEVLPPLQDGEPPVVILTKQKEDTDVVKPKRSLRKVQI
uniref:DNA polymerase n=1 Tax=viral metagenome TaxID=1070528 RepID=A0A6C0BF04_9ZZZZ